MRRNGRDAPEAVTGQQRGVGRARTLSGPSWTHGERPELVDFAKTVEDVFGAFALNTTIRHCATTRRSSCCPTVTLALTARRNLGERCYRGKRWDADQAHGRSWPA